MLLGCVRDAIVKEMRAKKQKIFYLITKGNWGGAQRYVYDLATNIPRDRFEIAVILGVGQELRRRLKARKIRVIQLSMLQRDVNLLKEIIVFFQLLSLMRKERPDILHVNSSKAGIMGALISRMLNLKCIFTTHGWAFNESRNLLQKKLLFVLHWITVLLAHQTIAVSDALKLQMVRAPFVSQNLYVVKNGIVAPHFKSRSEARNTIMEYSGPLKKRTESKENLIWIGTVGELHKTKGLRYAIDAMARLKAAQYNFIFVIMGGGTERAALEKCIRKNKLEDTVFMLGFMKDAPKCLMALDIFTLTSISEGLGYALLEAGAASLPTVATRVGGIPEIIKDGISGLLVPARSPKAIEKAITALLDNPPKQKQFGISLKKRIEPEFSQIKMVNKTLQYYEATG